MTLLVLTGGLLLLMALGFPVAFAMIGASVAYIFLRGDIPFLIVAQRVTVGVDSFVLLAIPFFLLAGELMNQGGITKRLVEVSRVLVGGVAGGLGHVTVVTNMIMAGMSGSGIADAAGTGAVLIPAMQRAGYGVPFAAAIVGAAGTIGPIIPPSIPFVIYGSLANTSIGRLLLAGAIPGVLMGIMLMLFVYFIAKRRQYPAEGRVARRDLLRATLHAIPPMGMPIIILGGIIVGVMTPTEAAAAGAFYAFILGFFIYRELKPRDLPGIIKETVMGTAAVAIIISAAQPMGWILTYEMAPMKVLALFQDANLSKVMLLLVLNLIFLVLGCFMEGLAVMVMAVPVLMPVLQQVGIDPLHFGVILVLNIMIGTITPPVGTIMYVVCALGRISIAQFSREAWPFMIALTISLFVVTYLPILCTWLPDLVMPLR